MLVTNLENKLDLERYGEDQCKKSYQHAIKLLAHKDYSRHKIREKLIAKDFDPSLVEELIELLVQAKYLREDFYIEARVKGLANKGYHPQYIQQKLKEEYCHVTTDDIEHIFAENHLSEDHQLKELIIKKVRLMGGLEQFQHNNQDSFKKKEKLLRFVLSKGFSLPDAQNYFQQYIREGNLL